MVTIVKAEPQYLDSLATLFNAYRVFYEQDSDLAAAKQFLSERMAKNESTIFVALSENDVCGFTQIYPLFSSVSLKPLHLLNDLFVHEDYRGRGIASLLLNEAKHFAIDNGSKGLSLETHHTNPAQALYERLDWVKDEEYLHYFWKAKH